MATSTANAAIDRTSASTSYNTPSIIPTRKRKSVDPTPRSTTASKTITPPLPKTKTPQKQSLTPVMPPHRAISSKKKGPLPTIQRKDIATKKIKIEQDDTATAATEPKEPQAVMETDKSDYDDIVFVYVGDDLKSFGIHKGLLVKASTFFKAALSTSFEPENNVKSEDSVEVMPYEDRPNAISLVKEDVAVFKRFKDWLYTDKIITRTETAKDLLWSIIIDIYVFAVRRGIPRLQNSCIDVAIQKVNEGGLFPTQAIINALWKTTGPVWPLRRLFLQLFAAKCSLKTALANNQGYCQRFLHDLVIILYEMKRDEKNGTEVDFWKARHMWHVNMAENPVDID